MAKKRRDVLFYDNSFEYVKNSLFDKISCMKDYYSNVCKAYTEMKLIVMV